MRICWTRTTAERLLRAAAAVAALSACAARAGADPIPSAPRGRLLEYETDEALSTKAGLFEPIVEGAERWQYSDQLSYKDVAAGSYVRVEKHLKLGAFYRLQYGARHNDDWNQTPSGGWDWQVNNNRPESVLVLDATPRAQLDFLPGGNWVGSLKTRYEYDLYDREETLKLEPELDWFWMDGLAAIATVALRYECDAPLNYGSTAFNGHWWYLAYLWHARPWLTLGPQVSLRDEIWTTSSQFRSANPGASYSVYYRGWAPGFTLSARLP
jgi:hypothetical protein